MAASAPWYKFTYKIPESHIVAKAETVIVKAEFFHTANYLGSTQTNFYIPGIEFNVYVNVFTQNCGMKAMYHPYFQTRLSISDQKRILDLFENYLYFACKCSRVIGSDNIEGSTYKLIKECGVDYKFGEPFWNKRNYPSMPTHLCNHFWKDLYAQEKILINWTTNEKGDLLFGEKTC